MPTTAQIVVAYDIADDKRRNRVAKCMEGYGLRVNYSVFECVLKPQKLKKMKQELNKLIKPSEDSIRIYRLCRSCIAETETMGVGPERFEQLGLIYI